MVPFQWSGLTRQPAADLLQPPLVKAVLLRPATAGQDPLEICDDEFVIGRADVCDLCLPFPELADFHAVIRLQEGTTWIESVLQEPNLVINGRPYKRLSLREGDDLQIGAARFTVHLLTNAAGLDGTDATPSARDLSAAELCDRLEADLEASERREQGWQQLCAAARQLRDVGDIELADPEPALVEAADHVDVADDESMIDRELARLHALVEARREAILRSESEHAAEQAAFEDQAESLRQQVTELLEATGAETAAPHWRAIA